MAALYHFCTAQTVEIPGEENLFVVTDAGDDARCGVVALVNYGTENPFYVVLNSLHTAWNDREVWEAVKIQTAQNLKVFEQNHGVYGVLAVVAESEKEAREIMSGHITYHQKTPVQEHPLEKGLCIANYGDC